MTQIETMIRVIDAWDSTTLPKNKDGRLWQMIEEMRQALEEALAKQEQGEPVAWISHNAGLYHFKPDESLDPMPLYITPQQRIWVGLTDEEMRELEKQFEAERVRTSDEEYLVIYPAAYWQWQRAIEDKLREKNT